MGKELMLVGIVYYWENFIVSIFSFWLFMWKIINKRVGIYVVWLEFSESIFVWCSLGLELY